MNNRTNITPTSNNPVEIISLQESWTDALSGYDIDTSNLIGWWEENGVPTIQEAIQEMNDFYMNIM